MNKGQRSMWETSVESNIRQESLNSTHNDWSNDVNDTEENQPQNNRR